MKRVKRHKIKKERIEGSSSNARDHKEHDLAYYIHDRVELMHQVFSLLKYKEIKAIAPECVRDLAIGDLQELCTEELLGISSKRLLAVLDGAEPPSDTESSSASPSPDELETISLDSISSDEEILNTGHKKKKHKHRSHRSSKKKEKATTREPETDENAELSKASRAGLTVLELLELQARARAIRAQLQKEQLHKNTQESTTIDSSHHSSDNEVEIKEEPADVVEISSSEDEKPDVNQLNNKIGDPTPPTQNAEVVTANPTDNQPSKNKTVDSSPTVTKRINDLVITVPQAKMSRKIKLNRNKVTISVPNENNEKAPTSISEPPVRTVVENIVVNIVADNTKATPEKRDGKAKKKKKDKKKKSLEKDGSDHDEITLQLSDSEKMDLFENLDESRKNYDKVSSSSEDSESSSDDSDSDNGGDDPVRKSNKNNKGSVKVVDKESTDKETSPQKPEILDDGPKDNTETEISSTTSENKATPIALKSPPVKETDDELDENPVREVPNDIDRLSSDQIEKVSDEPNSSNIEINQNSPSIKNISIGMGKISSNSNEIVENEYSSDTNNILTNSHEQKVEEINIKTNTSSEKTTVEGNPSNNDLNSPSKNISHQPKPDECSVIEVRNIDDIPLIDDSNVSDPVPDQCEKSPTNLEVSAAEKSISDGELSDRESSEVEAMDIRPEVVCISDEDSPKKKEKKKKKKKEKKSKKSKKSKSDFCEDADQNFYKDNTEISEPNKESAKSEIPVENKVTETIDLDSDEVCEIFELSDESSGSDVECTLLSKEPTAEEIEALSAKIDEIQREEVVTDEQIKKHEQMLAEKEKHNQMDENVEHLSWRDRYLDSAKVKKVLTTANIFNALRKKNKQLRKKIEDAKNKREEVTETLINKEPPEEIKLHLEEGSIEQYNTLQGSTKYVDPVKEPNTKNDEKDDSVPENSETIGQGRNVTNEMKKDAKQLLKMYRRLLKYNDIKKPTDPNKKKKKKQKKKEK